MSWLFGFYSKHNSNTNFASNFHPPAIDYYKSEKIYIAVGGNKKNILVNTSNPKFKYFFCGIPISSDSGKLFQIDDIDKIFDSPQKSINDIGGHFCGILIEKDSLSFFTDKLGLREFHIYENERGWYFSTRLDWILKLNNFEIDYEQFGSRWKLMNQISNKSIIKNILRLTAGSQLKISDNKTDESSEYWLPKNGKPLSVEDYNDLLEKNILIGKNNSSNISLSLSGGMDSRVLLSFLIKNDYTNWDCHTFLTESKMDISIAKKIINDFNIKNQIIASDKKYIHDKMLPELREYVGATYLTDSGFTSRKLMYYDLLPGESLIIDGGFGEIWRREFLFKLFYEGEKHLLNKNLESISNYLINPHADIFNTEYNSIMENGIYNQLDEMFNKLPSIKYIGMENWLDLFSLKTRLTNYYAPEQARIDNYVQSYMPFIQINLVENLFNVPVNFRRNGRLFKTLIKRNKRELLSYKLAKDNLSYPIWFSPLSKRLYLKAFNKFKPSNSYQNIDMYLEKLKVFVMDSLLSREVKEYGPYDYNMIYKTVNSYYSGNIKERRFVDWFITFEIFRQML